MTTKKEKPKLTGPAALWVEAMRTKDDVTAAELMRDNPREIASGLLAVPSAWKKYGDVAKRGLIPTASPMNKMIEAIKHMVGVEEDLLAFGNADPAIMAMRVQVTEIISSTVKVFGEAYKGVHEKVDALGPELADFVLPGWELQPEWL